MTQNRSKTLGKEEQEFLLFALTPTTTDEAVKAWAAALPRDVAARVNAFIRAFPTWWRGLTPEQREALRAPLVAHAGEAS